MVPVVTGVSVTCFARRPKRTTLTYRNTLSLTTELAGYVESQAEFHKVKVPEYVRLVLRVSNGRFEINQWVEKQRELRLLD